MKVRNIREQFAQEIINQRINNGKTDSGIVREGIRYFAYPAKENQAKEFIYEGYQIEWEVTESDVPKMMWLFDENCGGSCYVVQGHNPEDTEAVSGALRRATRVDHKIPTAIMPDGRYIVGGVMGGSYTLYAKDGSKVGWVGTVDRLGKLLNN